MQLETVCLFYKHTDTDGCGPALPLQEQCTKRKAIEGAAPWTVTQEVAFAALERAALSGLVFAAVKQNNANQ